MDKRIKNDIQQLAGIISGLLLYLEDYERVERERKQSSVIHLFTQKDGKEMARFKDGSFRRRGKQYEYRFMLGGKQIPVFGATKDDCYDKREKAIAENSNLQEDTPVTTRELMTLLFAMQNPMTSNLASSGELLGDWLLHWYDTYKKPHLKEHTRLLYERLIVELKNGELGMIALKDLTGECLQLFFNAIIFPQKRVKLSNLLRPALKKAVQLHLLSFNPFDSVEFPFHKSAHRRAFTFAEQTQLVNVLDGKYESVYWVLACTGLRIGEFLGLDYAKDINYDAGTITVQGGINIYTGTKIDSPKTENGLRVIKFLPELVPYLKRCAAEPFTYNMLRLYFSRLYAKLAIKKCSLYTFRHTFITLCAYVGIAPKYIQKLAGHASIVTTFDIYTDALESGSSSLLIYFEKLAKLYPKMN